MAQSTKQNEIIDLTEIVEKGRELSSASDSKVDFDSELSDLLDSKDGSLSLDDAPELDSLLAGLDDAPTPSRAVSADKPEEDEEAAAPAESATDTSVPEDLDALIGSLDELPEPSATEAGKAVKAVPENLDSVLARFDAKPAAPDKTPEAEIVSAKDGGAGDLDALISDLDMPENGGDRASSEEPSENVDSLLDSLLPGGESSPSPQARPKEISEEDLDDLLNSIELESSEAARPAEEAAVSRSTAPAAASPKVAPPETESFSDLGDLLAGSETQPEDRSSGEQGAFDAADLAELDELFAEKAVEPAKEISLEDSARKAPQASTEETLSTPPQQWMERLEGETAALREQLAAVQAAASGRLEEQLPGLLTAGTPFAALFADFVRNTVAGQLKTAQAKTEAAVRALDERLAALQKKCADLESRVAEPTVPTEFEARIAALEKREPDAETEHIWGERISVLENARAGLEAMQERLAVLESRIAEPTVPAEFEARVAALENREQPTQDLSGFKERLANVEKQVPEALNALQGQIGALEARVPDPGIVEKRLALLEERQEDLSWEKQQGVGELQTRLEELERKLSAASLVSLDERISALEARQNDSSLSERLAALEARSVAPLEERIVRLENRDMPDAAAIAAGVLQQVKPELDKAAARSAAQVLREELAALVGA